MDIMSFKKCHKPPMTGKRKHTTCKNYDLDITKKNHVFCFTVMCHVMSCVSCDVMCHVFFNQDGDIT